MQTKGNKKKFNLVRSKDVIKQKVSYENEKRR